MRPIILAALWVVFTQPIYAQSAGERYEIIGSFDVRIDDAGYDLISEYDHEKQRSDIGPDKFKGTEITIVTTRNPDDPVRILSAPRVSFIIWPTDNENSYEADVALKGDAGIFQADGATQNRLQLADFLRTDDVLSFSIAGELLPVLREGA